MASSQNWYWQTWQGFSYLSCRLLADWPHGFFTQNCWPHPPNALIQALHPQASVYRVHQVHGNRVLTTQDLPTTPSLSPPLQEADGLVTQAPDQSVWTCTADCVPVLVGDPQTGQVAAIHAGWRGTAARIVPRAIARLQSQGSRLADLRFALGPAISGEVYQVSIEVAAEVGATLLSEGDSSPSTQAGVTHEIIAHLQSLPSPPIQSDPEPGRVRLDVRRVNVLQLESLGVAPDQIAIAPHCTYQQPEQFFSYRRSGEKKVQWSGIVSR